MQEMVAIVRIVLAYKPQQYLPCPAASESFNFPALAHTCPLASFNAYIPEHLIVFFRTQ